MREIDVMKGILIISHGKLAEGMADSLRLFSGREIEQMDYLCLKQNDSLDDFQDRLGEKIKELDRGDGVWILTDLLGGTPANKTAHFITDKTRVITGVNFPMLLELFVMRESGKETAQGILKAGISGIQEFDPAKINMDNELF